MFWISRMWQDKLAFLIILRKIKAKGTSMSQSRRGKFDLGIFRIFSMLLLQTRQRRRRRNLLIRHYYLVASLVFILRTVWENQIQRNSKPFCSSCTSIRGVLNKSILDLNLLGNYSLTCKDWSRFINFFFKGISKHF